jgi:hypothetical protein
MATKKALALTAKQEAFCLAIVSGLSQSDAYRKAYASDGMKPATVNKRSGELMKNGAITGRIDTLRKPVVEKVQYDLENAMEEAAEAFLVSKSKENGGAMVAAVTLRAKLNGLLIDRKEITMSPMQELSEDALQRFVERKAKEAGVTLH